MPMKKRGTSAKRHVVVVASGGFDPIHVGHVRYLKEARALGSTLIVILNNDHWLRNKKGFVFMPEKERAELLRAFPFVDKVILSSHKKADPDRSVVRELQKIKPDIFANGGDRKPSGDPIPEEMLCKKLGIKMRYNVGRGGKIQSSSWMIASARRLASRSIRPWGEYFGWDRGKQWNLKTIYVRPKKRLSLQYHHHREEWWLLVSGDALATVRDNNGKEHTTALKKGEVFRVNKKQVHRLSSKKGGVIVEVAYGNFDENDIVRLHDDYGRVA